MTRARPVSGCTEAGAADAAQSWRESGYEGEYNAAGEREGRGVIQQLKNSIEKLLI